MSGGQRKGESENPGSAQTAAATTPAAIDRRPRPVLVELASALLIVGGALNLLLSVQVLMLFAQRGGEIGLLTLITIALGALTLALGVLVRYGQAWLLAVNVVAVLAFVELISGSTVGLLVGIVDVVVVLALFRERPWFVDRSAPGSGGEVSP